MTKTLNFSLSDSNKVKSLYWYVFHLFERNSLNCKLRSLSWIDLISWNILPLCCNSSEPFQSHKKTFDYKKNYGILTSLILLYILTMKILS